MRSSIFSALKNFLVPKAYAHCDIPCGIYDPYPAQMAAHTVIRMVNLIADLKKENEKDFIHKLARYAKVKEEQAELVKHEIRILWGDYFKEEHSKHYPELHNLVFKVMKLASKARQEVSLEAAEELLATVQKVAEIFYKTKGLKPVRIKPPYPTEGEIVFPASPRGEHK